MFKIGLIYIAVNDEHCTVKRFRAVRKIWWWLPAGVRKDIFIRIAPQMILGHVQVFRKGYL